MNLHSWCNYFYPMQKNAKLELLSPAKNLECGLLAINAGADAVYIGPEKFGARAQAGNSLHDISQLIRHAHKYYARVYAAVNTILTDAEMNQAVNLIHKLYEEGIDAVIIQDPGLLEADLPPIPIIASTQMHNNTPAKVRFLEQCGFSRVILPRESTLEEIQDIRAVSSVELEAFVHGALCVCYSGQCYMSYALGGRSGNRGSCAQPCRKPYTLRDEKNAILATGHLLSLKDLNLSDSLSNLIDAGITSFKIEGRLKEADYVTNITAFYRQKLDEILNNSAYRKSSSGRTIFDFSPDPAKSFSRGFTSYFTHGRDSDMASHGSPQSIGEYVGRIETLTTSHFILDSGREINAGDGICFFDKQGQLQGTEIYITRGKQLFFETNKGLWTGALVYRNHDRLFHKAIKGSRSIRKITVQMALSRKEDELVLSLSDEDGNHISFCRSFPLQPAKNTEQAYQVIQKQIKSLGDTEFEAVALDISLDPMEFIPMRDLNALRREAVQQLSEVREKARVRQQVEHSPTTHPYPVQQLDFRANSLNEKAKAFYKRHGVKEIRDALEKGSVPPGTVIMTTRYCLLHALGKCKDKSQNQPIRGTLFLHDEKGRKFRLRFNCSRCEMEIMV